MSNSQNNKDVDFNYININNNPTNQARNNDEGLNLIDKEDIALGYDYKKTLEYALRIGFIRKVYGILSIQLLLTVFMCALTFIDSVRYFFLHNMWLFFTTVILSIVIIIPLLCIKDLARRVPTNYILLLLWTFCEAYMVATCCANYDPIIVLEAVFLTCAVTISLTIYACTTKTDFTVCGGMLFVMICLLLCLGILSIFLPFLNTLYCVCGVLVYSIYLLYDTQLIMGKFGNEYEIDDYIIAAIMIYIDIIQIFLYLLQLLGDRR